MKARIKPNKNDGICLTCDYYYRCSASDKARGMACGDYRRKDKEDGQRKMGSTELGPVGTDERDAQSNEKIRC